jgi:hypothetical protein
VERVSDKRCPDREEEGGANPEQPLWPFPKPPWLTRALRQARPRGGTLAAHGGLDILDRRLGGAGSLEDLEDLALDPR